MNHSFVITDAAASRIKQIIQKQEYNNKKLRIIVEGGGCSGFKYKIDFDDKISPSDLIFTHNDIEIIIDDISINYLENSSLDFVEDLGSAGFEIKNPNATAKCGCGNSFTI